MVLADDGRQEHWLDTNLHRWIGTTIVLSENRTVWVWLLSIHIFIRWADLWWYVLCLVLAMYPVVPPCDLELGTPATSQSHNRFGIGKVPITWRVHQPDHSSQLCSTIACRICQSSYHHLLPIFTHFLSPINNISYAQLSIYFIYQLSLWCPEDQASDGAFLLNLPTTTSAKRSLSTPKFSAKRYDAITRGVPEMHLEIVLCQNITTIR